MSKVRFELNTKGVRELLRGEKMKQICAEYAQAAAARCGDGYESDTFTGKNRVNAMIYADTPKARKDNSNNNTLLKSLR